MKKVVVDVNALLRQVIELTRARWHDVPQQAGLVIDLDTELVEGLPPVLGVEGELREALAHVIFNAVDSMVNGGRLMISTEFVPTRDGAHAVRICIADTGLGMDEETRRRCLQPFLTTKTEEGKGQGIAMIQSMAQRDGGRLEIDSIPGRGTRVSLILPAMVGVAPLPAVSEWGGLSTGQSARRLRVLLIDDDPLLLRSVGEVLTDAGHHVQPEVGGREGIDSFVAALGTPASFDVVITDLGMPHVDGRQVASAVKAASPATPVVMLTGWGRRMLEDGECPQGWII
ncbi:response regulator [Paucibacter sp. O1-1]|nr:response regulator [Paucibacter sp. O1-1]MDA3831267.1 response regulator [Paucibacter sp. O1-1]